MSAQVRIGVIGLGFMGGKWAQALTEHPRVELAVVCDVRESHAKETADDLQTTWSADPGEAAGDPTLDGIVVCTPEDLHVDAAVAALESGTPVAIEKPLAHELAAAERIREASAGAGVPVLAAHILRFEPRYAAIKSAIDDGTIGAVQMVRSERIGVAADQRILQGRTSLPLYYGSHEFDLARWYAGDVTRVAARRSSGVLKSAGYDVDDLYSVVLEFAGGAHGTSTLGWSLPATSAPFNTSSFTVIGEHGYARVEQGPTGLSVVGPSGLAALDTWYAPSVHGQIRGALANQVDHFVHVVTSEAQPLCTVDDGVEAVRLCDAVERAAGDDAFVDVNSVLQEREVSR
ncbi:Gfo/Idh/MocA family oxidoreductase [Phytoactinopolyspora alkaliphila]|uniref:Gfo/Idh/MocA family oxidoreductase n=1 Tax=Phytoactinopolyspora alkaliphila TaxID=1783498 RepID=A0A6N9YP90_9ACTN|nr:Gfo/Idh/MocA family oxidoreductase [Phytoactinopolyspora alkaliphila]NED96765.1 Gfo/Idh/MocA family oxidoreductase [Phytoactinopolyspora alkaliphila]